ncbi:unnamed protein product [Arabidopsis thaliana]|uniref:Uncharacterized protein n=1 Tax=Arabidopsis thaliana TaxID=3702 RepID=A0A178W763_ARATH|nr:hypothetical protein AXX17_AT1G22000 [Arabidopsis thaliana]CAA0227275.1 unnamed protein product [Arabidopsis thaliana]
MAVSFPASAGFCSGGGWLLSSIVGFHSNDGWLNFRRVRQFLRRTRLALLYGYLLPFPFC